MEAIIGLILLIIVVAMIWALRGSISSWAQVAKVKSDTVAASVAVDSQNDLANIVKRLETLDKTYDSSVVLKVALGKLQLQRDK